MLAVTDFVETLASLPLLEPEQRSALASLQQQFPDVKALGKELIRRGWLTSFQANLLARGQGTDLVLDQYVLLDLLGQGGMGSVYKARQLRMDRLVALKVIKREALKSATAVERFQREARTAARLAHANIVTVFDSNAVNGVHFLVMEHIEGTDLAKVIQEAGALPVEKACNWIRQAALGLQHAHEKGLVHRDIKPHNLMLTKRGEIKVMDLGIARSVHGNDASATEGLTATGVVMGTPDYIAPEQAMNAKAVDIRADIYSLGCSLYHLLAGRVPFDGQSLTEKLIKHQLHEAQPLEQLRPGLPPGLIQTVRRMMAKAPEQRYQTPAEVAQALLPYAGGQGPTVADSRLLDSFEVVDADAITPATTLATRGDHQIAATLPVTIPPLRRSGPHWSVVLLLGGFLFVLLAAGVAALLFLDRPTRGTQAVALTTGATTRPLTSSPATQPVVEQPPSFRMVHGVNAQEFGKWLAKLKPDGYRLTFLTGTAGDGATQFVGIAVRDELPWEAYYNLTSEQYQGTFDDLPKKGYRPISLSGYPDGGQTRFALAWVKDDNPTAWWAKHGINGETEDACRIDFEKKGLHPVYIKGYPATGGPHYSSLFTDEPVKAWFHERDQTEERFTADLKKMTAQGYRPICITAIPAGMRASYSYVFIKEAESVPWVARHKLTPAEFQKEHEQQTTKGYRPLAVSGYRLKGALTYTAIWVKDE